ncbi:ATP-grasp fold amidoligase family protein [Janibacter sp. G56]|uniref:ATP-grasp fold amidoligase family protein n=1 Tax=Janibacter sp. G56 TaxID=3418717 RepID=UPI003CFCCAA4
MGQISTSNSETDRDATTTDPGRGGAPLRARARDAARRLPPLAWRDARIAELRDERDALRARLSALEADNRTLKAQLREVPRQRDEAAAVAEGVATGRRRASFGAHLHADRRTFSLDRAALLADPTLADAPRRAFMHMLKAYQFAQSHGVAVPEIHGVWARLEDIDWDALPDRFVLKSVKGFSSQGVYPLQRIPGGFEVIGKAGLRTPPDLTRALKGREATRRIQAPYFAEEVLEEAGHPGALPMDIKLYAFYGEVGHVLLRQMSEHANLRTAHWQYLDRDGRDLGDITEGRTLNPDLTAPANLPAFVEIAERLSVAVPTPMIRVDLYDTPKGIYMGEMTVLPGGRQHYRDDHDERLGRMWERADARLQHDLTKGRPFAVLHGDHPVTVIAEPPDSDATPDLGDPQQPLITEAAGVGDGQGS